MSDLLREQLSAFMDGELPREECTLLLKRVTASEDLGVCWHHWHLIGDTLRGEMTDEQTQQLARRVNRALDAEEAPDAAETRKQPRGADTTSRRPRRRYMRRGATIAASVAVIGVAGLVGALVSQHVGGSGQVLVPGAAQGDQLGSPVQHVNLEQTPQPVRAELNRYLLMHEVYGQGAVPSAHADNARNSSTAADTKLSIGTGGA